MRAALLALLLAAPAVAHADAYVELGGGLAMPLADDEYTNNVDPSLNLYARLGGGGPALGGMASVDWTPLSSDNDFVSFQRFRFMGHLVAGHAVSPKVMLNGRLGAGIDLVHESVDATIFGLHVTGSDSDVGLAVEFAGGAWFAVGSGTTRIGVEVSIPISYHSSDGNPNNPNDPNDAKFDFTSYDLDILGGVRLSL